MIVNYIPNHIGDYDTELTYDDYHNREITIPPSLERFSIVNSLYYKQLN